MITFILGTRPEVLKLAPVITAIPAEKRRVIWTGQHWSPELNQGLEQEIGADLIPPVVSDDWTLDLYSVKSEGERLARMLSYLSRSLEGLPSRWVVVQGDTTSALAGALAAAKLHIPVYHVEAGSRSGNRRQPEELNRILIDHAASGWSAAYHCDQKHLQAEGIKAPWHGDTLIDSLRTWKEGAGKLPGATGRVLATIHRAETLDDKVALSNVIGFLGQLVEQWPVTLYAHPHLSNALIAHGIAAPKAVEVLPPLRPAEFRLALARSHALITDSGGAATEAAYLGLRCILAREETELLDLVASRRIMVGWRTPETLGAACKKAIPNAHLLSRVERSWRGGAGKRIAEELLG